MKNENNKKNIYFVIIILIIIFSILLLIFKNKIFFKNKENNNTNALTNTTKFAEDSNVLGNTEKDREISDKVNTALKNKTEEEISSFSTKLSGSTDNRLTNIKITCDKLNGITINKGNTFSFENTLGPSKAEDGYKEATMFSNGKKVQALGGGNCQVSSTLYNAVLEIKDLEVLERHPHGKKVSYVPEGKDAAVSYGSIDFKFKNNLDTDIKLYFSTDNVTLTARIVKLV